MSKVDAQRALREARYAAYRASRTAEGTPGTSSPPTAARGIHTGPPADPDPDPGAAAKASDVAVPDLTQVQADPDGGGPELCGHRNIGNKSCQRPAGHAERNHRYK
jgi:hypothetical protein